jgi:hypothetical protein
LQERRAAEVQITQEKNLVELKLLVRLTAAALRVATPFHCGHCGLVPRLV